MWSKILIGFGVWVFIISSVFSQTSDITPKMVQDAITGACDYLKSLQMSGGNWHEEEVHVGGVSCLCSLALLNAGVPPDDPQMAKALKFIRTVDPTSGPVESTYVASLQTMVLCIAEPKRDAALIRRNVQWLIQTQKRDGDKPGSWGYPYGNGDPSNSQFALLALYEADLLGIDIPQEVWKRAAQYWIMTQNMDGSWAYTYLPPKLGRQAPGTGSITCAGIVSLLISGDKSELADAQIRGVEFLPCQRQNSDIAKRINHGKKWMESHFSVSRNPGNVNWALYYLYGLERMGRMTEQRFIGDHDWYREGVAELLRQAIVSTRGNKILVHWKGQSSSELMEPISTSLALLFLSKGRYPVLVTKLQFTETSEDWNNHRHDIHHLARFVEKAWQKNMTTQNVSLKTATVEDLLLSPVLYISGKNSPCPKDAAELREFGQKLRDYVDRGGFLVAEAACPGGSFDDGFRKLLRAIFPEKEHQMYPMPPDHPLWRAEIPLDPKYVRPIYCLDYGCRTCVLFLPSGGADTPSLSCLWELAPEMKRSANHPQSVKEQIRAGLVLGLNIMAYATERELKGKEESFALSAPPEVSRTDEVSRGRLSMVNLRHGGGCEVAPHALGNLLQQAGEKLQIRAGVFEETLAVTSPRLFEFPVAFMQGRHAFRFTDAERAQLRTFFERGGLLFANAVCASESFDASFRGELQRIFPDVKLEEIPTSDPIYTDALGGYDLRDIRTRQAEAGTKPVPIRLFGLKIHDRWVVVYSPLDISCALEKFRSLDCHGYTPEDAAKIGINVLLYTLQ